MKTYHQPPMPWKVSESLARAFGVNSIKKQLSTLDRICQHNLRPCDAIFFMFDYKAEKISVGEHNAQLFTGYNAKLVEVDGFDFYEQILDKKELKWFEATCEASKKVNF